MNHECIDFGVILGFIFSRYFIYMVYDLPLFICSSSFKHFCENVPLDRLSVAGGSRDAS